jgi:hypothetical protein
MTQSIAYAMADILAEYSPEIQNKTNSTINNVLDYFLTALMYVTHPFEFEHILTRAAESSQFITKVILNEVKQYFFIVVDRLYFDDVDDDNSDSEAYEDDILYMDLDGKTRTLKKEENMFGFMEEDAMDSGDRIGFVIVGKNIVDQHAALGEFKLLGTSPPLRGNVQDFYVGVNSSEAAKKCTYPQKLALKDCGVRMGINVISPASSLNDSIDEGLCIYYSIVLLGVYAFVYFIY